MAWQSSTLIAITENTAWGERHMSTQSSEMNSTTCRRRRRRSRKKKERNFPPQPQSMWFTDSSPGLGKHKEATVCIFCLSLMMVGKKKKKKKKKVSQFSQCATQHPDSSCLCRRDILEKVLEQFLHWYFFTSEWVCRWALRLDLSANALLQWGQENGFSPVSEEKKEKAPSEIVCRQIWIENSVRVSACWGFFVSFCCFTGRHSAERVQPLLDSKHDICQRQQYCPFCSASTQHIWEFVSSHISLTSNLIWAVEQRLLYLCRLLNHVYTEHN